MALFRRKPVVPGVGNRELGAALHKDVRELERALRPELAPDERVQTYFECPARDGRGERLFITTNQNLRYIDDDGQLFTFPHEALVGIRMKAGYVSVGFRGPTGHVAVLTAFIGGGPHHVIAMYGSVARWWAAKTGKRFPADEMKNSPYVPEIKLVPDAVE